MMFYYLFRLLITTVKTLQSQAARSKLPFVLSIFTYQGETKKNTTSIEKRIFSNMQGDFYLSFFL
jgi:hypothetical protein